MMTKYNVSIIVYLVCLATIYQCEVYYIGPSQLSNDADHHLTFPQFVSNSSDLLTNNTQLIFGPGNYNLESDVLVENIHSFSMFVESIFSSKAVIICDHNARFEFRNISTVTVSGFDFVGCFNNHVLSVGHLQLENSKFYDRAIVNGTVVTIDNSTATLYRVAFKSTVGTMLQDGAAIVNSPENCPTELSDRATVAVVLSRRSVVVVRQSWFEGNNVGLGRVINNYDGDITILNTTFVNNSAVTFCYHNCCFTGGLVFVNGPHGSTIKIYDCKFVQNVGVVIIVSFGGRCSSLIVSLSTTVHLS